MIDRSIAPTFVVPEQYTLPKAHTKKLKGNIPLHLLLYGAQPVLRIEFIFKAGNWYENFSGTSLFSCKMLTEGTTKYSSKEIQELYSYYGAFTESNSGQDNSAFIVYTLSKYAKEILTLTHHILTSATFPEEELENLKNIHAQQLKINFEKNAYLASVEFKKAIFGSSHPYGRYLTPETVQNVTRIDVFQHFENFMTLSNCDIFVSGFAEEDLIDEIFEFFSSTKTTITSTGQKLIKPSPSVEKRKIVIKEKSLQSSLRIGKRLFTMKHEDYFKMLFLNEILGGYFGSRLMQNIREDKGYTYGIHSALQTNLREGYFVIAADVKSEYTSHAIEEIYKEINILKTEPVPQNELETVRNYMMGTFLTSISSPFTAMDKFKIIHYHGLDYSFYDRYFHALKNTSAYDLMETANRYFTDDFTEIIVGKEK